MDFKQIEAFVYVAKYKSFSKAAEKLLLSQPTVSTHINTLEEELSVKIFDRLSKEVVLTEVGQLLYPYAVDMIDLRDRAHEAVKEFLNEVSGNLRIGSSTILSEILMPKIIYEFKQNFPKTFFSLDVGNSQNIVQRVSDGVLDLGLVTRKIPKKDLDYKIFLKDKIVLGVYEGHPFYKRDSVFLDEILNESFIVRDIGAGTRTAVDLALKQKGYDIDSLRAVANFRTSHSVIQGIKSKIGIGFISEMAINKEICSGEVKGIAITDLMVEKEIYLVYNKQKSNKKLLKQFIEFSLNFSNH